MNREDELQGIIDFQQVENKTLKELLGIAICPNAMNGCKEGILINPYGEAEQCQWCGMVKQALKG